MTALVLGTAWAALAVAAVARRRPPPARMRALGPAVVRRPAPDLLAVVGRAVLRGAGKVAGASRDGAPVDAGAAGEPGRAAAADRSARAVGLAAVAAVAALVVAPLAAPVAAAAGWAVPRHRARAAGRRRLAAFEADLPETVDLLVLAVGAGCNVPLALAGAGRRGVGPLAAELRRMCAEVANGRRLADALDDLPAVAGEPTRALAGVLARGERYGTPVLPALHRLADEVRLQRQRRAEAAARRVPVALLFPLVVCVLPAFALLTVAPLIAGALRELRL